jgi:putative ABC transport system substrate-binding protein
MDRRAFVLAITGGALARPFAIRAQTLEKKVYRIGFLKVGTVPIEPAFLDEMRRLGWIERQNLTIEPRYATSEDQLAALAAELVQLRVDVILTGGTPSALAAQKAAPTIPIVFIVSADPLRSGLVTSLARPVGNLTGFAYGIYMDKLLEALKDVFPTVVRFATPYPAAWQNDADRAALLAIAKVLGLQNQGIPVSGPGDLAGIYAAARKVHADAVVFFDFAWPFGPNLEQIAAQSVRARMPAIFYARKFVEAGGLLSYGPIMGQHWPRVAAQIDRILRGAKPADLPVERPTKFELVINDTTAKGLGMTISRLVRVPDDVIR